MKPPPPPPPAKKPRLDSLEISKGKLGPVAACKLEFRPLTILVGPQGSGKSLVAQVLYYFRNFRRLIQVEGARTTPDEGADAVRFDDKTVKRVMASTLDGLRSPDRRFAVFADPKVTLRFRPSTGEMMSVNLQAVTRQAIPNTALVTAARDVLNKVPRLKSRALFLPAERLLYSQLVNRTSIAAMRLPSTFHAFADWMDEAATVMENDWVRGRPDTEEGRWVWERAKSMLTGVPYRHNGAWKWRVGTGKDTTFDIDMASSGQRANWPVAVLAAALFSLRTQEKRLSPDFTVFVEEPEIHVHPRAQRTLMEILAFLARHGFRVVITTHSLVGVYVVNNLLRASLLPERVNGAVPPSDLRLSPDDVEVYLFEAGAAPRSIVDRTQRFIDEGALGSVSDELGSELNRIDVQIATRAGE